MTEPSFRRGHCLWLKLDHLIFGQTPWTVAGTPHTHTNTKFNEEPEEMQKRALRQKEENWPRLNNALERLRNPTVDGVCDDGYSEIGKDTITLMNFFEQVIVYYYSSYNLSLHCMGRTGVPCPPLRFLSGVSFSVLFMLSYGGSGDVVWGG